MYIDLKTLDSNQGFRILGAQANDLTGRGITGVGDINNDGIADFIIGAEHASPLNRYQTGESYVIYGRQGGYTGIDLNSTFSKSYGFRIIGATVGDITGYAANKAGDFNNDGFDDLIIGAYNASPSGRSGAGQSYIIYGKKGGYSYDIDLSKLDDSDGFTIFGANAGDQSGTAVSGGFDINSDGIDDIVIGNDYSGIVYVIYGRKGGYTNIDLASAFDTQQGFKMLCGSGDFCGYAVNRAGDINADGYDDIIVGAIYASPLGRNQAGITYVIYGPIYGNSSIDLNNLTTTRGFKVLGAKGLSSGAIYGDLSGAPSGGAGDINGDGIDDIVIGAWSASPLDRYTAGESYVIYGKKGGYTSDIDLGQLSSTYGFKILGAKGGSSGADRGDQSGQVYAAGDINSDGIADIIIGSPGVQNYSGMSYVIYGKEGGYTSDIDLSQWNDAYGLKILGENAGDWSGIVAHSAGDINNDGVSDIIIGSFQASPVNRLYAGVAYVIYGSRNFSLEADLSGDRSLYIDSIHDIS